MTEITPEQLNAEKNIKKESPEQRSARLRKARITIFRFACFVAAIFMINWAISPIGRFAFNGTPSIEGKLFFVVNDTLPSRGDIAAYHPPKGNLYPDEMWFGKYVVGVAGDSVSIKGRDFYINEKYIGTAKEFSSGGKKMDMSQQGIIPDGYYFFWSGHENSYDSRYADIGWIPKASVIGRMYRIF